MLSCACAEIGDGPMAGLDLVVEVGSPASSAAYCASSRSRPGSRRAAFVARHGPRRLTADMVRCEAGRRRGERGSEGERAMHIGDDYMSRKTFTVIVGGLDPALAVVPAVSARPAAS